MTLDIIGTPDVSTVHAMVWSLLFHATCQPFMHQRHQTITSNNLHFKEAALEIIYKFLDTPKVECQMDKDSALLVAQEIALLTGVTPEIEEHEQDGNIVFCFI